MDAHNQVLSVAVKTFIYYFGLTLALVLSGTGQAANYPPAVTGDVIIKFTDKSQPGILLAQAFRLNPNNNTPLQIVARQLSAELGVPLTAVRATSGQELVLSIDRAQLARTLKERLAREPAVQRVILVENPKTLLPAAELAALVKLRPDSAAQRQVQRDRHAGHRSSPELGMQVAELVSGVSPLPTAHIDDAGQLIVSVDLAELIRDLVIRLKRRADVVYAQPNLIVRPSLKREISPPQAGPQ